MIPVDIMEDCYPLIFEKREMAFGDYKTLGEAIRQLQVTEIHEDFLKPKPHAISDYFRPWLERTLAECPVSCSEWAVCENLIYPVLREIHRS